MGSQRCAWLRSIAAHALDALDPGERRALERHLRGGCPACERELGRARRDAASLAESSEPVAPPPGARARLVRVVRRARRRRGGEGAE